MIHFEQCIDSPSPRWLLRSTIVICHTSKMEPTFSNLRRRRVCVAKPENSRVYISHKQQCSREAKSQNRCGQRRQSAEDCIEDNRQRKRDCALIRQSIWTLKGASLKLPLQSLISTTYTLVNVGFKSISESPPKGKDSVQYISSMPQHHVWNVNRKTLPLTWAAIFISGLDLSRSKTWDFGRPMSCCCSQNPQKEPQSSGSDI
jgi:hypothetical protein